MRTNKMKNSTELFSKYGISAEDILEKKEKGITFFQTVENCLDYLNIASQIGQNIEFIIDAIYMCKDYINGTYRKVPFSSILAITGAFVYFLLPVDMIPDTIPILGYLDDYAVLETVLKSVNHDITNWKTQRQN